MAVEPAQFDDVQLCVIGIYYILLVVITTIGLLNEDRMISFELGRGLNMA